MRDETQPQSTPSMEEARELLEILGVSESASSEELHAAYLRKVREFPPDRAPETFERIRDAYRTLRDPRRRAQVLLLSGDPEAPFIRLAEGLEEERPHLGPAPWLEVLRLGRRRS